MAWMTSLFQGGRDPVDVERERVGIQAARGIALDRGCEELELADIEPLDNWAERWRRRDGTVLDRVLSVVDPRDGTRGLPQYLALQHGNGGLLWFNKAPAHRQPKR